MDNPRLASRSEQFVSDDGIKITKRCYFLAVGDDDVTGNAFTLVLSFNAFDEPTEQKRLEIKAKLANIIVEMCPDVLKSITQLIPEFKAMFRFKDLFPNKPNMARQIELLATLHFIREKMMSNLMKASDETIHNYVNMLKEVRAKSKSEEQIKRLETYNDRVMIKKLKGADKALKDIDFDIEIEVSKISANITGN